jgi:hypothetical protein
MTKTKNIRKMKPEVRDMLIRDMQATGKIIDIEVGHVY